MKKKSFLVIAIASIAFYSVTFTGCKGKDGEIGPSGTNGTNGTNGTDGYGAVTAADQAAYDAASGSRGGILYDNWTNAASGITGIPTEVTSKSEFFRCKSCHAWDGLGNKGSYINRAGNASRPNCASSDLRAFVGNHNIKETFLKVKNEGGRTKSLNTSYSDIMPDYSALIADADVWDLVKYLYTEAFNVSSLYDYTTAGLYPTGTITFSNIGRDGSATNGNTYYTSNCVSCHGADGKLIATVNVGKLGRTKPNEVWHKVKFGQLGSSMDGFGSSLQQIKDLYVALQDTLTYPN